MSSAKVALTLPQHLLDEAKKEVVTGRAKSLSALVSEALDEKLRRDALMEILDAMESRHGPSSKTAKAWAKRVLRSR
jgi:Arc/MetJ-type ribon-helix-helix transcriptional regulator